MPRKEIQNRADVELLINTFYDQIRAHEQLGPIFNGVIADWEEHLAKLADFWETNLFFVKQYKGNPMKAHLEVDKTYQHTISQAHFGLWLQLWFTTIDSLFVGEKAELAKERARNMAHSMFMRIFEARENKTTSHDRV